MQHLTAKILDAVPLRYLPFRDGAPASSKVMLSISHILDMVTGAIAHPVSHLLHRNNDFSSGMPCPQVSERFNCLNQRVATVDNRGHFARFHQPK